MHANGWFAPHEKADSADLRLICFPFAGSGSAVYRQWQQAFSENVAVIPVQLPGRERRMREPAFQSMEALVEDLLGAEDMFFDAPYAIFGHSMGGQIGYELARRLTAEGRPPEHLFVSARRPPNLPVPHPPLFDLPKPKLLAALTELYGPFPKVFRDRPAMLDAFIPTMRADLELIDTWTPRTSPMLPCPLTALAGTDDHIIPPSAVQDWAKVTAGPFQAIEIPGDHFFLRERPLEIAALVASILETA